MFDPPAAVTMTPTAPPVRIVALLLFLQHLFSSVLLLVLKEVA